MNNTIKNYLSRVISITVQSDFIWSKVFQPLYYLIGFAERERHRNKGPMRSKFDVQDLAHRMFPDLTVKHGLCKGLKYPSWRATGSVLFPKLLGSYEKEIQDVLALSITKNDFEQIIDVGCAEGYYSVGLALVIPYAHIFAFDIDNNARELCYKMAKLNNVDHKINIQSECNPETLKTLVSRSSNKTLIISDCEGYEKHLFDESVIPYLSHAYILCEIHDVFDIDISATLKRRFELTHRLTILSSVDDIKKAQNYKYLELEGYDLATRFWLLSEHRKSSMEWFYWEPKDTNV